jgi:hypothetical protein
MKYSKKVILGVATSTAAVLVVAGAAFAWWTDGGTGSGSADTGNTSDNLTINAATSGTADLVPDGSSAAVSLTVSNTNSYSVSLNGDTASVDAGTIKCGATSVPDSWFDFDDATIDGTSPVAAGASGTVISASGLTFHMLDQTANQNVCKDAAVTFDVTVAQP